MDILKKIKLSSNTRLKPTSSDFTTSMPYITPQTPTLESGILGK